MEGISIGEHLEMLLKKSQHLLLESISIAKHFHQGILAFHSSYKFSPLFSAVVPSPQTIEGKNGIIVDHSRAFGSPWESIQQDTGSANSSCGQSILCPLCDPWSSVLLRGSSTCGPPLRVENGPPQLQLILQWFIYFSPITSQGFMLGTTGLLWLSLQHHICYLLLIRKPLEPFTNATILYFQS